MRLLERNIDLGIFIIRLSIGILMLLHGIGKLMYGVEGIEGMLEASGMPAFIAYGAYIGEVVAPLFIIIGLATRGAALVFVFNMIVAISMAHAGDLFTLNTAGGWMIELQALYIFGALALVFTGGGKYAVSKKHIWD